MDGLINYNPQTNQPYMAIVCGQFTVTTGGTATAVSPYNRGFSVAETGTAGVYRVTLSNSRKFPAAPVLFASTKAGHANEYSMWSKDAGTLVAGGTTGQTFDIAIGDADTPARPTGATITVNFMAIFQNSNVV